MKVSADNENGKLKILLSGELDHPGAREAMFEIERLIEKAFPRECILDMSGLTFMDSSGIALILKTFKRINEVGGRLIVENVPKQPMRVLDASGIERIISISILSK